MQVFLSIDLNKDLLLSDEECVEALGREMCTDIQVYLGQSTIAFPTAFDTHLDIVLGKREIDPEWNEGWRANGTIEEEFITLEMI